MVGFLHIAEKIFTSIIEQTSYLHNFSSKAISICSLEKGINSSRKFFIKKGAQPGRAYSILLTTIA